MQGGSQKEVTISIGTPYCDRDGLWRCPYQIGGIGKFKIQTEKGVDSLQALLSAIEGARLSLKESDCRFSSDESKDVGSGIPILVSTLLGPRFEERVLKAIEPRTETILPRQTTTKQSRIPETRKTSTLVRKRACKMGGRP